MNSSASSQPGFSARRGLWRALWRDLWADAERSRWATGVGSALLALLLYGLCLSPTVTYGGDCGELIAASYRLGIGHPSGYPFFCLLGRLFADMVPLGEVGWRYNLLSAILGAAGIGLFAAASHRLLWDSEHPRRAPWSSGGAALLLAGFIYYGSQSVIAEVYSLNAFFLALLLWHAVSWLASGDWRHFYALALSFGLSLTAHLSGLFLGPALLGIAIIAPRARFAPFFPIGARRIGIALLLCAAGFALTVYLPLRSRLFPLGGPGDLSHFAPLDWGHPADFASWKAHVTAKQYSRLLFTPHKVSLLGHVLTVPGFEQPLRLWPGKVASLLGLMSLQMMAAAPLVPLGLIAALRARRAGPRSSDFNSASTYSELAGARAWVAGALAAAWAVNVGIQINYDVNDIVNFFFPAYLAQAMWMAFGLDAAGRWLWARTQNWQPMMRWRARTVSRLSLLGMVALQWVIFHRSSNYSHETGARSRALEIASSLEKLQKSGGARPVALIYSNDSLWGFWYAQFVLNRAAQAQTPWGALASEDLRREPQDHLVARIKARHHAPVAISEWDDRLDARFPLQPLDGTTEVVLASDRALPAPATPVRAGEIGAPGRIFSARFRRTPLTRVPWESTAESFEEALLKMNRAEIQDARSAGVPALKRGNLAAIDVDFARPTWPAQRTAPGEGAAHIGWLQVLAARLGTFDKSLQKSPPPRQFADLVPMGEMKFVHVTGPQIGAWTQSRRLIVPISGTPGARLRAAFTLTIEGNATDGLSQVWARLVRDKNDVRTPWQRVDLVQLSHN